MKNIIFLTDFSENSDNALEYLAAIANQINESNIYIIHTYSLATKTGMFLSVKERMKEDATALLLNRKRKLEGLTKNKHFVFFKAIYGELSKIVEKLERQLEADLILTSMHGYSSSKVNLIGPNAGRIIKKTNVPLLLVPPKYKYQGIKKITFGLRQPKIGKKRTVRPLKEIQKLNNANIRILVAKSEAKKFKINDLHLSKKEGKVTTSSEKTLYQAIMKDNKSNPADLLCVIRRKRGFFEKWLKSGSFKRSLFDTDIPMLVLRGGD